VSETDRWGETAEAYLTSSWHANEAALAHMIETVGPDGGEVLDVGTGVGHAAFAFAPHVDRVVASDTSPGMLEVARRAAQERGVQNVEFEIADGNDLPFEDSSFDGVVCRTASHHFVNPEGFVSSVARVLRPGGWFLLVDTVGSDDPETDDLIDKLERLRDPTHVRNHTVKAWKRMTQKAGLKLLSEDEITKPLNAKEWMDRQGVEEPARSQILDLILSSQGWFREYLRPHGEGDSTTFHLREATLLFRKE
jgi:ubiquinone/menaquinone biosynthesis C-methylase UbiE